MTSKCVWLHDCHGYDQEWIKIMLIGDGESVNITLQSMAFQYHFTINGIPIPLYNQWHSNITLQSMAFHL